MAGIKAISFLMDRSGSISATNWANQVRYTAEALRHPEVLAELDRIFKQGHSVVFNALQFNNTTSTMVEWTPIRNHADVETFIARLSLHAAGITSGGTDMALGITTANSTFGQLATRFNGEFKDAERIIDISTDGEPDDMEQAKMASIVFEGRHTGIPGRINGIAIGNTVEKAESAFVALRDNIVTRDPKGKTYITNWDDFPRIIAEKLRDELIGDASSPRRRAELNIGEDFIGSGTIPAARQATPVYRT